MSPLYEQCPIFLWMHKAQGSLNFPLGCSKVSICKKSTVDGTEILHYLGCTKPINNGINYQPHLGFLAGFLVAINGALCLLLPVSHLPPNWSDSLPVEKWRHDDISCHEPAFDLYIYILNIYIYMEYVSGKNIQWLPTYPWEMPQTSLN